MSNLIAVAYPDVDTAGHVADELAAADEGAVDRARGHGRRRAPARRQGQAAPGGSTAGVGAAGGALWGGLIGLIFLVPLFGMAVGAATGAAAGALTDVGVDDKFMKTLGEKLREGGAALVVLVRQSTPDKVLPRISQYGGEVIQSSLDNEAEARLEAALAGQAATA